MEQHLSGGGVRVDRVPVDLAVPDDLVALAGPVVAWTVSGTTDD